MLCSYLNYFVYTFSRIGEKFFVTSSIYADLNSEQYGQSGNVLTIFRRKKVFGDFESFLVVFSIYVFRNLFLNTVLMFCYVGICDTWFEDLTRHSHVGDGFSDFSFEYSYACAVPTFY